MNKQVKFTITIDCYEDGSMGWWKQEKEAMTPADRQRLNETLSQVKQMVKEKNTEIIHKPPEESAA